MKLSTYFDKGEFVVTGEVGPIKGAIPRDRAIVPRCAQEAEALHGRVHAINVTDNQSAVMRLGSLAASVGLKARGHEPIYQLTCRDRNRIALQSDILTAYSLGVDNMLLLTGDHIKLGDHKTTKPVFDLDSVQLIKMARGLMEGHDIVGNEIENSPDFTIAGVVNPNFLPLDLQLMKMKSPQMGNFMNKNVSGITVPQEWIDEIGSVDKSDRKKKAAEMMGRFIKKHKNKFQGVHIMPLGWTDIVPHILDEAGISVNGVGK
ncbi:MAG: hypothetical protein B6240_01890 [Desulfobacteraceae bacterium 4572_87]|nr:MAG: hypothetical protein B6240_01890 [Desulfobacteraceae bacterium 4572_87]